MELSVRLHSMDPGINACRRRWDHQEPLRSNTFSWRLPTITRVNWWNRWVIGVRPFQRRVMMEQFIRSKSPFGLPLERSAWLAGYPEVVSVNPLASHFKRFSDAKNWLSLTKSTHFSSNHFYYYSLHDSLHYPGFMSLHHIISLTVSCMSSDLSDWHHCAFIIINDIIAPSFLFQCFSFVTLNAHVEL